MLPTQHWARSFTVNAEDIEHITNLLLEKETPLSTYQLAHVLVEGRLAQEVAALEERYKDARFYNPAESYDVGQKLVFPAMDYATAQVTAVREGANTDYGAFNVIAVQFEDNGHEAREFASALTVEHKLSQADGGSAQASLDQLTPEEIIEQAGDVIVDTLATHLREKSDLIHLAGKWFPIDLILDVNEGHLNLAEAVLDIYGGTPMPTSTILNEMGGLGASHISLQEFSMNYALNDDKRFDEVGPSGEVLWTLTRMEPDGVQRVPELLQYKPIDHDRAMLSEEMLSLEAEIADELSPLDAARNINKGTVTLNYAHRRAGTLPLSWRVMDLFPTAKTTERIWVTLIDAQDDEAFPGWVVREERYVYGLAPLYAKYALPIGAHVVVRRGEEPGQIIIDLDTYKARSEWIPLLQRKGEQFGFETSKRAIGADYDDLMILGIDELEAIDELVATTRKQRQTITAMMKMLIPGIAQLNPQGTAHVKSIYSALNVLRRCPPGPLMATLVANPDFEYVGDNYWKLAD